MPQLSPSVRSYHFPELLVTCLPSLLSTWSLPRASLLLMQTPFFNSPWSLLGVFKKTEKPIKLRKPKKNNRKNQTVKKKRLNRLKFWKNRPVRFGFLSLEPEKPNRTGKKPEKKPSQNRAKPEKTEPKPSQTEPNRKNRAKPKNRARPVWTGFFSKKPNRTETGRFEPVSVFFKKKSI